MPCLYLDWMHKICFFDSFKITRSLKLIYTCHFLPFQLATLLTFDRPTLNLVGFLSLFAHYTMYFNFFQDFSIFHFLRLFCFCWLSKVIVYFYENLTKIRQICETKMPISSKSGIFGQGRMQCFQKMVFLYQVKDLHSIRKQKNVAILVKKL